MEDFLVSEECHFGKYLRNIGLFPYLKRIRIEPYFYQLKNSTVSGNVSFFLNDESKAIIVRIYKNTYSSGSDEMTVLSNNKILFWNDEYGDSFTTFKDIKRTPVDRRSLR